MSGGRNGYNGRPGLFIKLRMARIIEATGEAEQEAARVAAIEALYPNDTGLPEFDFENGLDAEMVAEAYADIDDLETRALWSAVFYYLMRENHHSEKWREWEGQEFVDFPMAWVLQHETAALTVDGDTDEYIPF